MSTKEGAPGDLPGAFVAELENAARAKPASKGDPLVSVAFALGWQMAELYRPARRRRGRVTDDLPGLGSLSDDERVEILADQIQAAVFKLDDAFKKAGLARPDLAAVRDAAGHGEAPLQAAVLVLHRALLGSLTAADFRLGKAYGLGRALADTCRKPSDKAGLHKELDGGRVANLLGWLDDLTSALPPHAAHSVARSLEEWRDWLPTAPDTAPTDTLSALRRQGELWRALLSGEKQGAEMLDIKNYLDAARSLATQMRTLLRSVVARFPVVTALILVLIGGGIALLILGGGPETVAGAGSLIAALGLTWKGIGASLGQLVGRLEQPLWYAAIDAAVSDAINLLPDNGRDHHGRRALALQMHEAQTRD